MGVVQLDGELLPVDGLVVGNRSTSVQPIDEFDSLTVPFDRVRVFRGGGNADGGDVEENEVAIEAKSTDPDAPTETTEPTDATEADEATDNGGNDDDENDDEDGDGNASFSVIELGGASVDLTQVLVAKAMGVFEGELPAGRYTKIELSASGVEGLVDGAVVDGQIPSGKLMITKPFELTADGTLEFVFDITVVKKGSNGNNLLSVIGESGIAGQDVEVEEVGSAAKQQAAGSGGDDEEEDESTEAEPTEVEPIEVVPEETDGGNPPDDPGQGNGPPDESG